MINVTIENAFNLETILNRDNWQQFAAVWPLAKTEPDWDSESAYKVYHAIEAGPTRVTEEEASALIGLGVKLNLVPLPGAMLVKMQDRHKWEHGVGVTHEDLATARAVQITVPDVGLLRINEVCVVEDACTDILQDYLNEGWRILAVCPPNAARRPDYILGRTKSGS